MYSQAMVKGNSGKQEGFERKVDHGVHWYSLVVNTGETPHQVSQSWKGDQPRLRRLRPYAEGGQRLQVGSQCMGEVAEADEQSKEVEKCCKETRGGCGPACTALEEENLAAGEGGEEKGSEGTIRAALRPTLLSMSKGAPKLQPWRQGCKGSDGKCRSRARDRPVRDQHQTIPFRCWMALTLHQPGEIPSETCSSRHRPEKDGRTQTPV